MMRISKVFICFVFTCTISLSCNAQKATEHHVGVAFYNCENFFDITDNPAKQDEEFTPDGKYHYTQRIYEQKLHNIATVIQALEGNGAAVIGMAEVENNTVLNDLVRQPEIARTNYKYVWYDGPDPRGINVAMIYNPTWFRVIESEPLHVMLEGKGKLTTRDVLHVTGLLNGDTVHIFVNHWPSRRGGEEVSGPKREQAAGVVKDATASILRRNPHARIIIMGDLNDNPTDNSVALVLGAKAEQSQVTTTGLYDPWVNIHKSGQGTEVYKHEWNLFDQVIISGGLLEKNGHHLHYDKAEIFKPEFIIDHYKGHEGEPHRSFVGTHWINGYSDHFPVILYLSK
jgi:predicted extracellular nuclease